MLIPSIDLQNGRVVQLQRGEITAFESADIDWWLERFAAYPIVQVIDLDAARGLGANTTIVRRLLRARACQLGGGIRTAAQAAAAVDAGAVRVIAGSALVGADRIRADVAASFAKAVGVDRFVAAVDLRGGFVTIDGWKTMTPWAGEDVLRALEPYAGAFLTTLVDGEGMMGGIDMAAIGRLRAATGRRLIAAGGVRSHEDVSALDALDVDAVVGMAIYTGAMRIGPD